MMRTPTHFERLWQRKRKREDAHKQRVKAKQEQLAVAEALKEEHEARGNGEEVSRLTRKIRLLRQELRYMNKGDL